MQLYEVGFVLYWARNSDHAGVLLRNQHIDLLLVDARVDAAAAFEFCSATKASHPAVKIGLLVRGKMPSPDISVDFIIVRGRLDQETIAELKK
jgi:DNA-binding response OmpR family regulator